MVYTTKMQIQKLAVKEQLVKTVVKSGNGGAVWVPKDWLGKEVVVILPEKPKLDIKEKIIHLLEPHLKDIISVAIYGSYARNEQTSESDIDVLVITKDKNLKLDLKKENIDVVSLPFDKLKKAIEKYPVLYYQMLREAEPLINADVIETLKSIKINKENFKDYLIEAKEHLKSSSEFLDLDKLDGAYLRSFSVIYSVMLRLKGLFIINSFSGKNVFTNKKFKQWVINKGIRPLEFESCYKAYSLIRDNKEIKKLRIKIDTAEKLLNILEKELAELESTLYGKQEEKAEEGN